MTVHGRHAFAANLEYGSALRAFRYFQRVRTFERRNLDFCAECRLRKGNRDSAAEIAAISFEEGVLFDMQHDVEIASRPSVRARLALPAVTHARAVFDPCWDFHFEFARLQHPSLPTAIRTWVGNHLAGTFASRAGPRNAEESLLITNLAATAAGAASLRGLARSNTRTRALLTGLVLANFHFFRNAEYRFFEIEIDILAQIRTALCARAPAPTAASAKEIAKAEQVAEDIAEILEDHGVEIHSTTTCGRSYACMTVAVIGSTLLRIGQHRIGFRTFLKSLFGIWIVRIAIGMILHGELAVSAFDLLIGGRPHHTEYFVVIALCVGCRRHVPALTGSRHAPALNSGSRGLRFLCILRDAHHRGA